MFYLIIILFGVGWILMSIITNFNSTKSPISHKYSTHGKECALIWLQKLKHFLGTLTPNLRLAK